jgi:iron-sulfur cluster assembly accessory protein
MINVTVSAASKISELLAEENKTTAGLRVFVQGGGCSGFQYGLMIDEGEGDESTDAVIESNGVKLLVDPASRAVRGVSPAQHRDERPASAKATAVRRSRGEGGCARRPRRAEREYRLYLNEAQRRPPGCSARRMPRDFHHGLLIRR